MPEPIYELHVCDVCLLLDNDLTAKESTYCKNCDAWICKDDVGNWGRRAKAWRKKEVTVKNSGG